MLPILALLVAAGVYAQPADLVITGARIYTVNPAQKTASAIAVKDGRILAVGQDVSKHVGEKTRRIEARGATIIPGLIDSHVHMEGLGDLLEVIDLRYVRSVAEVAELVRREAARRPAGEWIRGRAWDQTHWGGQFPTARDLAAAAPNHPVYLTRVDGHAAWVNPRALELAGITAATQDPPGGKIIRDASGAPTGVLIDRAAGLVSRKMPGAERIAGAHIRDDQPWGRAVAPVSGTWPGGGRPADCAEHQADGRRCAGLARGRTAGALFG